MCSTVAQADISQMRRFEGALSRRPCLRWTIERVDNRTSVADRIPDEGATEPVLHSSAPGNDDVPGQRAWLRSHLSSSSSAKPGR
jgi:hypothetical protein